MDQSHIVCYQIAQRCLHGLKLGTCERLLYPGNAHLFLYEQLFFSQRSNALRFMLWLVKRLDYTLRWTASISHPIKVAVVIGRALLCPFLSSSIAD